MSLSQSSLCVINENTANIVVVLVFLFSFIIFKMISILKDGKTNEEKIERKKQAEEYFNTHLRDNKEFFN